MKRLNLGCGLAPKAGWVNNDRVKLPGVDVVHDLDVAPWPWDTGSVDYIEGLDVFEHVNDPVLFMNECGRVLKNAGTLYLRSPHWRSEIAYTDPTHRRYCTERTWDYWIDGTEYHEKYGEAYCAGGVAFGKVRIDVGADGNITVVLRRV